MLTFVRIEKRGSFRKRKKARWKYDAADNSRLTEVAFLEWIMHSRFIQLDMDSNHCYTIIVWLVIVHPIACTINLVNNLPRVYKATRK